MSPESYPLEMTADRVMDELASLSDPDKAGHLARFFKTGKGQYGYGDRFRGIRVPVLRQVARIYRSLSLDQLEKLLASPCHEDRFTALIIMVDQYKRGGQNDREAIFSAYLDNVGGINSWDLVDVSAEHILGAHLKDGDRSLLVRLAESDNLWERRMAVMATFHYIKDHDFHLTLNLAETLLHDPHDLIHKATGWMLREIGNRNREEEEKFLKKHYRSMPRTMLRYAIEKFPEALRTMYLKGAI